MENTDRCSTSLPRPLQAKTPPHRHNHLPVSDPGDLLFRFSYRFEANPWNAFPALEDFGVENFVRSSIRLPQDEKAIYKQTSNKLLEARSLNYSVTVYQKLLRPS